MARLRLCPSHTAVLSPPLLFTTDERDIIAASQCKAQYALHAITDITTLIDSAGAGKLSCVLSIVLNNVLNTTEKNNILDRKGSLGFGHGSVLVKLVHCSSNLLAGAALVSNSFRPFRPPADVRCRSERAGLMAGRLPQRVLRLGRHSPTVWLVTYAVERGQAASSQNSWNDFQVRAARASHACPAHSLMQVSRTSVTHRLVRALAAATAARAIAAPQADMYHSCACLAGGSRGGPLASQQASFE